MMVVVLVAVVVREVHMRVGRLGGREWYRSGSVRLGRAGERDALEGGLGVDVHLAGVDAPARAERRAAPAGVVLVRGARGEARRVRELEERVVVCEEVGF